MSVIVVAEFPMTEQGAQDFIDWSKSDDGYIITRQHKGFEDIRTFLAEDKKTIYLYEKWDSKEDHQAYLDFRVKDGLMDFLNPRLDGDFKVTYFSEEQFLIEVSYFALFTCFSLLVEFGLRKDKGGNNEIIN